MSRVNLCIITSASFPPKEGIGFFIDGLAGALTKRNVAVAILGRLESPCDIHRFSERGIIFRSVPPIPLFPFHRDLAGVLYKLTHHSVMPDAEVLNLHSPLVPWIPTNLPSTATVHSTMRDGVMRMEHTEPAYVASRGMLAISSQRIEKKLFAEVDAIAASAHHVAESLRLCPYSVPDSKITVLGNGVDTGFFRPDAELVRDQKTLLWTGRLAPGKGLMNLVDAVSFACSKDPRINLRIAGTGPLEPRLKRAIAEANLEGNVRLLGHLSRPEVLEEYQRASLFVFDSRFEGLPTVVLEAMACGTPCLCGAIEGITELITDNHNGFLVEPGRPEILGQRILDLLDSQDAMRIVGENARASVITGNSWDKVAERYIDFFEQTLQ